MAAGKAAPATVSAPVPAPAAVYAAAMSKYSSRVVLRTVLERSDGGLGLVGERLVVGGWVKSSKEEMKEAPAPPPPAVEDKAAVAKHKDVSCVELFENRIPLLRSIMKVFGGGSHTVRHRIEVGVAKPQPSPPPLPQPSVVFLQISDGSCVTSLQVCELF